jgi:hypothetical protein
MANEETQKFDAVAWARRVNSRWIVHHGLGESAEKYLDKLSRSDPERLARSCAHAHRLTEEFGHTEDPKPWFYAGLFSLATANEARQFLNPHPFTASTISSLEGEVDDGVALADAGEETRNKIARIRETVRLLLKA